MFKFKKQSNQSSSNQENNKISIADELDKLVSLKEKGILSELEFEKEKDKLLNGAKYQAQQPTFIIQNSASSSSSASATAVVKRSGCLSSIIKALLALFVIFLILDFIAWSSGNKTASEVKAKQLISDKQCNQLIKDLIYHKHAQDICLVEAKLGEFNSNLNGDSFAEYSTRNGCPQLPENVAYKLQEETSLNFINALKSSPSKVEFCKKELPY
ncbi:TPA: SHOCT domain-containing protein, partial [Mannheimia haemolytica]|nr:SHOCT domain-containing protein [Mannheimia haemolytica]